MDKCVACQFYDRQHGKSNDGKGIAWGQCRRMAPMLNPINPKQHMIEGVWPHVRDDDWCGEWKQGTRRPEVRAADAPGHGPHVPALAPLLPAAGLLNPRPAGATVLQVAPQPALALAHSAAIGNAAFGNGLPGSTMSIVGRGD